MVCLDVVDMDKDMVDMVGTNLEWEIHKRKLGRMTQTILSPSIYLVESPLKRLMESTLEAMLGPTTLSRRLMESSLEEIVRPTALSNIVAASFTNGVAPVMRFAKT